MTRFNTPKGKAAVSSPVKTTGAGGTTFNGAPAFERDEKSELFLLGVASMFGTDTFYEKGADRDRRFKELVRTLAITDPAWTAEFLKWLRQGANMRTIALVGAAEFVKARLDAPLPPDGVGLNRQVVASVLRRADEPGEMIAYWTSTYGRNIPKPVKRGVADAVRLYYTERNLLKYDTPSRAVRFGDVLELTHPETKSPWQGQLFKYAIDRRQGREEFIHQDLHVIATNENVRTKVMAGDFSVLTDTTKLSAAGMTWEDALSLAGSKVDKKVLWEALIPTMGIMAQVRNLRNFDQAGVSDEVAKHVIDKLQDRGIIAMSRMFPFRFLAAYRHAPSLRWAYPLEQALNFSVSNVPSLPGKTLILVDQSYSMTSRAAGSLSDMSNSDVAQIFGAALAQRAENADLFQFDNAVRRVNYTQADSVLTVVGRFTGPRGGTNTEPAVRTTFRGHDRVIVITDEQANSHHYDDVYAAVPKNVPVYTWNLVGYRSAQAPSGGENRHTFGGLTDQAWNLIPMLEAGKNGRWPWENAG